MKYPRRYWETHKGKTSPLLEIHDYLRSHPHPLETTEIKQLADKVKLPEATLRGIISYYTDWYQQQDVLRVCQGTSCILAGAGDLYAELSQKHPCKAAYCLGYCDRSPAVLDSHNQLFIGKNAKNLAEISPVNKGELGGVSIRCLASEAYITRRIAEDYSPLAKAQAAGVYTAFREALTKTPEYVLSEVERSGQRGRGGAGFPTGKKWRSCAETKADTRYVVANGDEGDPGSYIDRILMENDPHGIIEGMLLCGYAIGAKQGIIFIRSEYPTAITRMREAIAEARNAGIFGSETNFPFELSVFPGMGSYVCGEETALLAAIEGLRGEVQIRPPYPTVEGLYGKPTVVNNVETFVNIPLILSKGAENYAKLGTALSSGTKAMCLNHGFARPGIVEVEFGLNLRDLIEEAGGSADGKPLEAIILGGPMGTLLLPEQWDIPICYGKMAAQGIQLGHGGLVALPQETDYKALLLHWLEFMVDESCGKCVPCRLGSQQALDLVKNHLNESDSQTRLESLLNVMEKGSLCAFGQFMPQPMQQMIKYFRDRIFS